MRVCSEGWRCLGWAGQLWDTCWDVRGHQLVWGSPWLRVGTGWVPCSSVQNPQDGGALEGAPDVSLWWGSQDRLVAMSSALPSTSHGSWLGRGQPSTGEANPGAPSPCSPTAPDGAEGGEMFWVQLWEGLFLLRGAGREP